MGNQKGVSGLDVVFYILIGFIIFIVGLVAIGVSQGEPRNNHSMLKPSYFVDERTHLCFATSILDRFTNVPCTDEVMNLIEKKQ